MYRRSEKIVIGHPDATLFRRKFCERVFQQPQAVTLINTRKGVVDVMEAFTLTPHLLVVVGVILPTGVSARKYTLPKSSRFQDFRVSRSLLKSW
jgi:hypothetical protein